MTTVISLKGRQAFYGPTLEHATSLAYVGRATSRGGWHIPGSPLYNPYSIKSAGTREAAVTQYGHHLLQHPELLAQVTGLRGKTIACWCTPNLCHGHLLAYLVEQDNAEAALKQWLADGADTGITLIQGAARIIENLYELYDPNWDMPFDGYAIRRHRITKKTSKRIFYTDRFERIYSIDRQAIERDGQVWDRVHHRTLYLREPELPQQPVPPSLAELKQAMVDSHPDKGGRHEDFLEAHRRYEQARDRTKTK